VNVPANFDATLLTWLSPFNISDWDFAPTEYARSRDLRWRPPNATGQILLPQVSEQVD